MGLALIEKQLSESVIGQPVPSGLPVSEQASCMLAAVPGSYPGCLIVILPPANAPHMTILLQGRAPSRPADLEVSGQTPLSKAIDGWNFWGQSLEARQRESPGFRRGSGELADAPCDGWHNGQTKTEKDDPLNWRILPGPGERE